MAEETAKPTREDRMASPRAAGEEARRDARGAESADALGVGSADEAKRLGVSPGELTSGVAVYRRGAAGVDAGSCGDRFVAVWSRKSGGRILATFDCAEDLMDFLRAYAMPPDAAAAAKAKA